MLLYTESGEISEKSQIIQKLESLIQSLRIWEGKRSFRKLGHYFNQLIELTNQITHLMEEHSQNIHQNPTKSWQPHGLDRFIGKSKSMEKIYELVSRAARTDLPVLIQGESGTGKELIARAIHEISSREKNRFFSENCAALPESLLETELFGYTKGAFTGANKDKVGILQLAHGGTLFLDEIGDMSLRMQAKLLRAIQEGEIRKVGGEEIIKIDLRIISATNKILEDCIRKRLFREDFYYRINVICIDIPPLRKRKEDIPLLVDHFFREISRRNPGSSNKISMGALELLQKYHWPGNIRELMNTLERTIIMGDGKLIDERILQESNLHLGPHSKQGGIALKTGEQLLLEEMLILSTGDKTKAAIRIGWSRPKLYRKMKQYGLHKNFGKSLE